MKSNATIAARRAGTPTATFFHDVAASDLGAVAAGRLSVMDP